MNIEKLKAGMIVKNYKELCLLLDEKIKTGESKKYHLIDMERHFSYEKKGHKFIITEIFEKIKDKFTNHKSNNILPFIDEMEVLLLDLLLRSSDETLILSTSKLMLELCMINPNYHKYFMDRENLSNLLDMNVGYIIDFYDTTNSTFKSAINTVTKRLESKKLIIHESIMMVQFVDTNVTMTPTGHPKISDVLNYDPKTDSFTTKEIKHKEIYRAATDSEREFILKVERFVLESKYKADNIQEVFKVGKIHNYYQDVSKILFKELNIKKAYKANRYTYNIEQLKKQKYKLLSQHKLIETRDALNLKVMIRIDENSNKRYEKAMTKLLEFNELHSKKPYRVDNEYVDNINTVSNSLIDIYNTDSLKVDIEDNRILNDILD